MAEALFAEHGLDRVSIRDITEAAGVNIAAVNYHFATKDALILAMAGRPAGLDRCAGDGVAVLRSRAA